MLGAFAATTIGFDGSAVQPRTCPFFSTPVHRAGTPPVTPSVRGRLARDSAVGRDLIQSAPNLRCVHAESAQQHRRGIWWLEGKDRSQHLLGRELELTAVGFGRILQYLLCRGRHAEAIVSHDVSDPRLLRHSVHRQAGVRRCRTACPRRPELPDRATQGPGELAAGSRPIRLRSRDPPTSRARRDRCQFGDHLGDEPPHWPADKWSRGEAPLAQRVGWS